MKDGMFFGMYRLLQKRTPRQWLDKRRSDDVFCERRQLARSQKITALGHL